MRKRVPIAGFVAAALAVGACVTDARTEQAPPPSAVAKRSHALGVPQNGFPSWGERLVLTLTNRARADPDAEMQAVCPTTCSGNYSVGIPLIYDYNLNRAARFHATTLRLAGAGLQHDSICQLKASFAQDYPDVCDGSPSCACVGGTFNCHCTGSKPYCTCSGSSCGSASARTSAFGSGYSGENAAAGNTDPIKSFEQWVKSTGHRNNMLNTSHRKLGVGGYTGAGACWKAYWVQDFSRLAVSSYPVIASGAHYPRSGSASTQFSFWANHYESGGVAPQLATVNVGGTCHAMARERGQNGNATYQVKTALSGSGCLAYYFYFRDSNGQVATYPSSGSYLVGVGNTSCPDYDPNTRPSPGQGCGGCSSAADCDDSNTCTTDTCEGAVGDKRCKNTPTAGCCTSNAQCDDGKPCTTDTCSNNACVNTPKPNCCTAASQCDDSNVCTTDSCSGSNVCQNAPVAGCCTSASQCNDSDGCTSDVCVANACQNTPIQGCCAADGDCDDGSSCTTDSCVAGSCTFTPVAGCCQKDGDCADTSPCTTERCEVSSGTCVIDRSPGCCDSAADCDDSDPCTTDSCAAQNCQHAPVANCTSTPDSAGNPSDGGALGPLDDGAGSGAGDGGAASADGSGSAGLNSGGDLLGGCNTTSGTPDLGWLALLLLLAIRRRRRYRHRAGC